LPRQLLKQLFQKILYLPISYNLYELNFDNYL